jgi:hypothetical protein
MALHLAAAVTERAGNLLTLYSVLADPPLPGAPVTSALQVCGPAAVGASDVALDFPIYTYVSMPVTPLTFDKPSPAAVRADHIPGAGAIRAFRLTIDITNATRTRLVGMRNLKVRRRILKCGRRTASHNHSPWIKVCLRKPERRPVGAGRTWSHKRPQLPKLPKRPDFDGVTNRGLNLDQFWLGDTYQQRAAKHAIHLID